MTTPDDARAPDHPPLAGERWVVVCEEEVLPATTGGRVDHRGFLEACSRAGVALDIVVPAKQPIDAYAYEAAFPGSRVHEIRRVETPWRHLGRRPYVVLSRPIPDKLADLVSGGQPPTAIVSYSVRVAHIGLALAARFDLSHLVRPQNLDSVYFGDLAQGSTGLRRAGYLLEARKMRAFEATLDGDPRVSAFADVSAEEAVSHRGRTGTPVLHVPSFALGDAASDAGPETERAGVLFLGSLDVETNQQALLWMIDEVWPAVRAATPEATLRVVGRRPTRDLTDRITSVAGQGVTLHADVPSVEPFLRSSLVTVNPARTGAGINVKLLQGIASGCAGVSTSVGASGLDWVAGRDLLVADSAADFAAAVCELLGDADRRTLIATAGAELVRERLDPARNVLQFAVALGRQAVA